MPRKSGDVPPANNRQEYTPIAIEVASLVTRLSAETAEHDRRLGASEKQLGSFEAAGKRVSKGGGGFFDGFLGGAAKFGLAMNGIQAGFNIIGNIFGAVIGPAASFDQKMAAIRSTSGATNAELKQLKATALALGMATDVGAASADDAANAIFELGKAGISVKAITGGVAKSVLQLAAAAGPEFGVANAAALAAKALNTFKLDASQATRVVNTLVGASNASSIGLSELKQGFSDVAAVAAGMGMSIEDTSAALAILGDNGLSAGTAGGALKTMLLNLQPGTEKQIDLFRELGIVTKNGSNQFFDAAGHVRDLAGISEVLKVALAGQTDKQRAANLETLFGSEAIAAANVLYGEGADGVKKFTEQMVKQGDAAGVAANMSNNLTDKWAAFQGTLQTMAITAADFLLPFVSGLTDTANAWAGSALDYLSRPDVQANISKVVGIIGDGLTGAWRTVSGVAKGAWENVLQPALKYLTSPQVVSTIKNVGSAIGDLAIKGWNVLMSAGSWLWTNAIKPFLDYVGRADVRSFIRDAGSAIGDFASRGWGVLSGLGTSIWTNQLKPFFEWVSRPDVSENIGKIARGIGEGLGTAFRVIEPLLPIIVGWFVAWKLAQFASDAIAAGNALLTKLVPGMAAANAEAAKGTAAGAGGSWFSKIFPAVALAAGEALLVKGVIDGINDLYSNTVEKRLSLLPEQMRNTFTASVARLPEADTASLMKGLGGLSSEDFNKFVEKFKGDAQGMLNSIKGDKGLQISMDIVAKLEGNVPESIRQQIDELVAKAKGGSDVNWVKEIDLMVRAHPEWTPDTKNAVWNLSSVLETYFPHNLVTNVAMTPLITIPPTSSALMWAQVQQQVMAATMGISVPIDVLLLMAPKFEADIGDAATGGAGMRSPEFGGSGLVGSIRAHILSQTAGMAPIEVKVPITVTADIGTGGVADFDPMKLLGVTDYKVNTPDTSAAVNAMRAAQTAITGMAANIKSTMAGLVSSVVVGSSNAVQAAGQGGSRVVTTMRAAMAVGLFLTIGLNSMSALAAGERAGGATAIVAGAQVGGGVRGAVAGSLAPGQFFSIGYNVGSGLAAGVRSSGAVAIAAARAVAAQVNAAMRDALGVHSDSVYQIENGVYVTGGLAKGMYKGMPAPLAAAKSVAKSVNTVIAGGLSENNAPLAAMESSLNQIIALAKRVVGKGTKDLMESFSSVTSAASGAFDFSSKLGSKDYMAPTRAVVDTFFNSVEYISVKTNNLLNKYKAMFTKTKGELAGFAGQVVGAFTGPVDTIAKLGAKDWVSPSMAVVEWYFRAVDAWTARTNNLLTKYKGIWDETHAAMAEFGGRIVAGLGAAIEPLSKLAAEGIRFPVDEIIGRYFGALDSFTEQAKDRISLWWARWSEAAAVVADSVGKAVVGLLQGVEPLDKLGRVDFYAPPTYVLDRYFSALDYFAEQTKDRISEWWLRWSPAAATVADSVAKSVVSLLSALEPMDKAARGEWFIPARDFLDRYFTGLNEFAEAAKDKVSEWQLRWAPVSATVAKALTDSVISLVGALEPLSKFARADLIMPTRGAVKTLVDALDVFAEETQDKISEWWARWNNTTSPLIAKALTDTLGSVVGALENLKTLNKSTLTGLSVDAAKGLLSALDTFAKSAQDYLSDWWGRWGATTLPDIAKNVSGVVSSLLGTLDPLMKLAGLAADKLPSHEVIVGFFLVLDDFITELARQAIAWHGKALPILAEMAGHVGEIATGVGKVFDPLLKIKELAGITPEQIEGAMSLVWEALHQFDVVMRGGSNGTPFQGDWTTQAVAWAIAIGSVFTELQKALSVIGGTKEGGGTNAFFDSLRANWMSVFGPAQQEGTLLFAVLDHTTGFMAKLNEGVLAGLEFMRITIWGGRLDALRTNVLEKLADMKAPFYDAGFALGQAVALGFTAGLGTMQLQLAGETPTGTGSTNTGTQQQYVPPPPPPPGKGYGASYGGGSTTVINNPIYFNDAQISDPDLHKLLADIATKQALEGR